MITDLKGATPFSIGKQLDLFPMVEKIREWLTGLEVRP